MEEGVEGFFNLVYERVQAIWTIWWEVGKEFSGEAVFRCDVTD